MKRVLTQKVEPSPACAADSYPIEENLKPISPEANRRVCTSAAMIGLAISMGASSLLLPQQGDSAMAAEPTTDSSPVSTIPASATESASVGRPEVSALSAAEVLMPKPHLIEHKAQQGQTIGSRPQTDQLELTGATKLPTEPSRATTNVQSSTLSADLKSPSLMGMGHDIRAGVVDTASRYSSDHITPQSESYSVVPNTIGQSVANEISGALSQRIAAPIPSPVNDLLKARQAVALNNLKDASNRLKSGQAEWGSEESVNLSAQGVEPYQSLVVPSQNKPGAESVPESVEIWDGQPKVEVAQPVVPTSPESVTAGIQPSTEYKTPEAAELPQVVVPEPVASAVVSLVYKVQPGDTLYEIAQNYGVSPAVLAKANQISNPTRLQIAQVIAIPPSESTKGFTAAIDEKRNRKPLQTAYVRPGQQLPVVEPTVQTVSSTSMLSVAPGLVHDLEASRNEGPTAPLNDGTKTISEKPVSNLGTDDFSPELQDKQAKESTQLSRTKQLAVGEPHQEDFSDDFTLLPEDSDRKGPRAKTKQHYSPYVERLRAEISQLREQYQNQHRNENRASNNSASRNRSNQTATPAPSSAAHTPINPEFNPSRYNEDLQAEIQRRAAKQPQNLPQTQINRQQPTASPRSQQRLLATAPTGADAYQPYQPSRGQLVAPDLPPLNQPDLYLPGGVNPNFNSFTWPTRGVLTSGYGRRWGRMHKGIDIAAPTGTPIFASAPGVVVYARWNPGGYGNLVDVRHPDGSLTRYAHNSRIFVQEGQVVEQGQQISAMGSTGRSTGPHLHFEVHPAGRGAVNPMAFLPRR